MPVPSRITDFSATAASNSPAGTDTIGTTLDDYMRAYQAVTRGELAHKGSDIASVAGTTDIGAVLGLFHDVTGAEAITGLGTIAAGVWKILKFEGAATLTYNATSLILPGAANIVCANGDVGIFISEGSGNWRCLAFMKTNGSHLGPVLTAEQASTSGTAINFTGIPPWVKKITVLLDAVSTNGTTNWIIQIGDSGGLETGSYASTSSASGTEDAETSGFQINNFGAATVVLSGAIVLHLQDLASNTWVASGILTRGDAAGLVISAGVKALSATLDRLTVTTIAGADTFDAGAISIMYE